MLKNKKTKNEQLCSFEVKNYIVVQAFTGGIISISINNNITLLLLYSTFLLE